MALVIQAANVHQGGGKTLLDELMKVSIDPGTIFILDRRYLPPVQLPDKACLQVNPTLFGRLKAELFVQRNVGPNHHLLCFGNLPPLIKRSGVVFVFLQNRYLIEKSGLKGFSWTIKIRLMVERFWFRTRMKSHYKIIVQSLSMQRELKQSLGFESIVLPFAAKDNLITQKRSESPQNKEFDFVYVSSAEPHKNHAALLDAWVVLAEQGVRPNLALTVSQSSAVAQLIEQKKNSYGLRITNFGTLQHGEVQNLYANSKALIFPSKLESFGLPLIEAQQLGMPILAPELDYVRDVVEPSETFDADSPTSIARAVLRHTNIQQPKCEPICAAEFLRQIQKQGEA